MSFETQNIKQNFRLYLEEITIRYIPAFTISAMVIISWFAYSDLFIRQSVNAFYTRLIPLALGYSLLFFHYLNKGKNKRLEYNWYNILTLSTLLMMYAKYLVYLPYEGDAYSVTGIIVLIFILALDFKVSLPSAILSFFGPLLATILTFLFVAELPDSKWVNYSNLFPMTIIAFIANRAHYRLRYKLFKSNYLLNIEQQNAKELYEETLCVNEYLNEKNEKIEQQKKSIIAANKELRKLSQTKDKFFSIISHDLKTPFNSIIGFSSLLSQHYDQFSDEDRKNYLDIIEKSANNTHKLLDNLLEWSQLQNSKDNLKLEKTNLFLLGNEIIALLQQMGDEKEITLINNIEADTEAKVDINKIKSVMRNLVSNAIKFTKEGGSVTLESNTSNGALELSVADTGIGIEPDKVNRLFNISEKVSTPGTNKESGTGLGLLLCDEFVKRHNGRIWVVSEINKGTTFKFSLPQNTNVN
ncbi:HAMP domain-containing histidine kinase [Carboxylicivirga sp. A043]|uniref:sensor histidine kinase n=1 Tax=Carboxylicivirga litoralis TaxID=2816963 RepID=UPI0021CB3D0F|nr:HAMP domain-containing sensor histidine kinase [Carboxylicivirga sp. A043]MCU4155997.1 HAMP domain-containing histidine kinase [Carboxylicivirga sp. A043]